MLKAFHVLDGAGIKALAASGITTAVISGRESPITLRRCAELGIRHVAQGIADKATAFDAMRHELGKTADVCGYMGDDDIDVPVMKKAGFAATVPNAADGVAAHAHWGPVAAKADTGRCAKICDLLIEARRFAATAGCRPCVTGATLVLSVLADRRARRRLVLARAAGPPVGSGRAPGRVTTSTTAPTRSRLTRMGRDRTRAVRGPTRRS